MQVKATAHWFRIALADLLIAALIGAVLRLAFVTELPWLDFRNALHGHSHVAMLGWGYLALYVLLIHSFLEPAVVGSVYRRLFWLTQLTVLGMLISFPLAGYGVVSISFSTAHIILAYVFFVRFFRDTRSRPVRRSMSYRFAVTAMVWFVLSSLALWAMGPLVAFGQQGSSWYYATIQFFLHFQLNGWFIFGVLALFFRWLESRRITLSTGHVRIFYALLVISCLLTYVLAVTWSTPLDILFWINSLGVVIQLAALLIFYMLIRPVVGSMRAGTTRVLRALFGVGILSFVVKIFVQTAVVIPYIATIAYTIRNYVIGFIHLILLGLLTHLLIGFANSAGLLRLDHRAAVWGVGLLVTGFVITEMLLGVQGTMFWMGVGFIPYYYELLLAASCLLPVAIMLLLMRPRRAAPSG
ncbi:MAG: hypothetical protein R3301_11830 [Saprospiraceae bacterium]|nr:hypothetical protein [Saprospiraceae bacterium]